MSPEEASKILYSLAQRNEDMLGDIQAMGYDQRALVESSGDLEVIEALRLGAQHLDMAFVMGCP